MLTGEQQSRVERARAILIRRKTRTMSMMIRTPYAACTPHSERRVWLLRLVALLFLATATPVLAFAQIPPNVPYDGRAVLARIRFPVVAEPAECLDPDGLGDGGWSHDYPMSVQGMMKAATEVTSLEAPVDSFTTIEVTRPEFMKYPMAMATETGCWSPSDAETKALRTYMEKGGFLLLDDLTFGDGSAEHLELAIARVEVWMKRVFPMGQLVEIPRNDPVFRSFFAVGPEDVPGFGSTADQGASLWGVYEDNDPSKRLLTVATFRGILGHHWRWVEGGGSGLGEGGSASGKAYRLGLNILVYGLSH